MNSKTVDLIQREIRLEALMNPPLMYQMTTSNLSKIKPKLRTTGQVTGNWGKPKVAGSNLNDLGIAPEITSR